VHAGGDAQQERQRGKQVRGREEGERGA